MTNRFLLHSLALAAALVASSGAHAALTAYANQASFLGTISSPGVDSYTGFSITASTASPITRSAGSYTYSAAVSGDSFYGAGTTADPWLSTDTATDTITFSGFSGGVSGIGGFFFDSTIAGAFAAGDIKLTALDSLGASLTLTISGSATTTTPVTPTSFLGFKSTGTITSLTVIAVQPADPSVSLWPTVDNLTLGVTAVPEPETYALLLAGLGIVGAMTRRRRRG